MEDTNNPFYLKIQPLSQATQRLNDLKSLGPMVFTNGVFDVLHRGHVTYLEQARALGASLVVALNTDASAKRLGKGPQRPLNNEVDRAWVIAALESVSLVTWFDEDTPLQAVKTIAPDFLVKGGDYDMDLLEEARWVRERGGQALAIAFVNGYSTTQLVQKIQHPSLSKATQ